MRFLDRIEPGDRWFGSYVPDLPGCVATRTSGQVSTKRDRQRIVQRIRALADDPLPTGCQKLSGYDRYRLPQGRYRVVYEVRDAEVVVVVIRIGHRRDVYCVR
mgnify:FL=1